MNRSSLNRSSWAVCATVAALLSGCASSAEDVPAAYVSPIAYQGLSCGQLREEAARVSSRAAQAAGLQNDKARNDAIATAAGVVIFLPALLFIKGDGPSGTNLANLKGEAEAIERASIKRGCEISIRRS